MRSWRWIGAALLLSCGSSSIPESTRWWRDSVVYEVFVRSFADSNGDGVGDLAGLTAHLDDLNDGDPATTTDLGVDAVWLMPISPSPSYHGYDVTDYTGVNPSYGTLADFDAFVAAAHARGIKVVLDMVLNHSSSQHPWFIASRSGTGAPERDFYVWSASQPSGWSRPWDGAGVWYLANGAWYYALFGSGMPDLNLANPAVEAEMASAMRFWLARGVDGFRLDAVRYLVETGPGPGMMDTAETHALLRRLRCTLRARYPNVLLAGEAWTGLETVATYYGGGNELHLAFSFDLAEALKTAARDGVSAPLENVLARTEAAYPDRSFEAPFLSNHDQVRTLQFLAGDAAAARVAAATLLAMPGTPFVYYGEELGMQGGTGTQDQEKRTIYHWNGTAPGYGFTTGTPWYANTTEAAGVDLATERADPGSLWNLYRRLIAVRRDQAALRRGAATRPAVTGGGSGAFALLRADGASRVLFVANFANAASGPFTVDAPGTPSVLEQEGLSGAPTSSAGKVQVADLGPRASAFIALQ